MTSLIAARNLKRDFDGGRIVALAGVSIEIERGECIAIVGPSGCGKSTLLNLLCGLDHPGSGDITLAGRTISGRDAWARARARHMGVVFQDFALLSNLTARENVEAALIWGGASRGARERSAAEALARVGLAARADSYPRQMSGGERQRVAMARALVNKPDILFADEPTGSLDRAASKSVLGLIDSLRADNNLTTLIVTHDPTVAARCTRVVSLADGVIVEDITNADARGRAP